MRRRQGLFLHALDTAPQTICHFDLHPANLFGTDDETVLIDWSFVGIGALGEDAGNLVADAVLDFHVDPMDVVSLYDRVRRGYVSGLQDAGWSGPAATVDLAMRASIAAKFAWIAPAMLRAALEKRTLLNGRPIDEAFPLWAGAVRFLISCGEEALALVDEGDGSQAP